MIPIIGFTFNTPIYNSNSHATYVPTADCYQLFYFEVKMFPNFNNVNDDDFVKDHRNLIILL